VYLTPEVNGTRLDLGTGIDPRRGLRLSAAVEGSHETLGAEADFLRLHGGVRWLRPIGEGRTTVLLRGEAGVLLTDDVDGVPLSRRFFTGGDQSVRGYGFESIGPLDANGEPSGGKYLNVASVEFSRLVRENWRVAAFADAGRAFTVDADSWQRSVGLGVRYLTPFGQIRLDLGIPLNEDAPDDFRLHLTIGPPL
jgi:translocation and assembly module TamA